MSDNKTPEETRMTHRFQHQDQAAHFITTKSAPRPQHGQKADKDMPKLTEKRSFEPRPGH